MREASAATAAQSRVRVPALDRDSLEHIAQRILRGAMRHGSAGHARIVYPGAPGPLGADIDGLEGFARTFLARRVHHVWRARWRPTRMPRLVRGRSVGGHGPAQRRALAAARRARAGQGRGRFTRLRARHDSSLAMGPASTLASSGRSSTTLHPPSATRPIPRSTGCGSGSWSRLSWLPWAGPSPRRRCARTLTLTTPSRRPTAGCPTASERAFDHYGGWALHTFPALWARMDGARDLAAERAEVDVRRLDRYLDDALGLVGADGSPLIQGRSLSYRFAAAAPFWAGILSERAQPHAGDTAPCREQHRRALCRTRRAWGGRGVARRLARRLAAARAGVHRSWIALLGFEGPDRPRCFPRITRRGRRTTSRSRLSAGMTIRAIAAPGWLASGNRRATASCAWSITARTTRSRARSSATLRCTPGWATPRLPSRCSTRSRGVARSIRRSRFMDADGVATHRAGFRSLGVAVDRSGAVDVGIAGSVVTAHWLSPDATAEAPRIGLHRRGDGRGRHHGRVHRARAMGGPVRARRLDRGRARCGPPSFRLADLRRDRGPCERKRRRGCRPGGGPSLRRLLRRRADRCRPCRRRQSSRLSFKCPVCPHARGSRGVARHHGRVVVVWLRARRAARGGEVCPTDKDRDSQDRSSGPTGCITDTLLSTYLPGLDTRPPGEIRAQGRATYPPMEEK